MQAVMANNNTNVAGAIRRQASTAALRHYAASLPLYTVSQDLPDYFSDMLEKLEAAEKQAQR